MQIDLSEAKNRLSQPIEAVQAGEEVVIANDGAPMVRLVPAGASATTTSDIGTAGAIFDGLKTHPLPAYARRSSQEIDAAIEDERHSRD
jgi:prevent-host-death family protein